MILFVMMMKIMIITLKEKNYDIDIIKYIIANVNAIIKLRM